MLRVCQIILLFFILTFQRQQRLILFPYTTLFRSTIELQEEMKQKDDFLANTSHELRNPLHGIINIAQSILRKDRKSTRLNSSHVAISYAVFCLKKKIN